MPARSFHLSLFGAALLALSLSVAAQDPAPAPEPAMGIIARIDQRTEAQCAATPDKCEQLKTGGEKLKAQCAENATRCDRRLGRALDKCDSNPEGCDQVWGRVMSRVD